MPSAGSASARGAGARTTIRAVVLLGDVALREPTLPGKLRRLLADKDAAHYSPALITVEKSKTMVRQAAALLAEADAREPLPTRTSIERTRGRSTRGRETQVRTLAQRLRGNR